MEGAIKRKFLGPVEIILIVSIIVFAGVGVVYAGVAGLLTIPGVPALLADEVIQPPARQAVVSTASPESTEPSPGTTAIGTPPTSSPSPTATESPTAETTPSLDALTLAKQRDEQRLTVLAPKLQVALKDYQKKHGAYPLATSFAESWTNLSTTPLKVLVDEKYIDALPVDPVAGRKIGYRSVDGKSYVISVTLEDTSRPGGSFVLDSETNQQLYIYTIAFP
jgi:hypothetical protein